MSVFMEATNEILDTILKVDPNHVMEYNNNNDYSTDWFPQNSPEQNHDDEDIFSWVDSDYIDFLITEEKEKSNDNTILFDNIVDNHDLFTTNENHNMSTYSQSYSDPYYTETSTLPIVNRSNSNEIFPETNEDNHNFITTYGSYDNATFLESYPDLYYTETFTIPFGSRSNNNEMFLETNEENHNFVTSHESYDNSTCLQTYPGPYYNGTSINRIESGSNGNKMFVETYEGKHSFVAINKSYDDSTCLQSYPGPYYTQNFTTPMGSGSNNNQMLFPTNGGNHNFTTTKEKYGLPTYLQNHVDYYYVETSTTPMERGSNNNKMLLPTYEDNHNIVTANESKYSSTRLKKNLKRKNNDISDNVRTKYPRIEKPEVDVSNDPNIEIDFYYGKVNPPQKRTFHVRKTTINSEIGQIEKNTELNKETSKPTDSLEDDKPPKLDYYGPVQHELEKCDERKVSNTKYGNKMNVNNNNSSNNKFSLPKKSGNYFSISKSDENLAPYFLRTLKSYSCNNNVSKIKTTKGKRKYLCTSQMENKKYSSTN